MIKLQTCSHCQTVHYPERDICPACWKDSLEWTDVCADGTLSSLTDLHVSTADKWASKLPLRIGLVKLDCGPNILVFVSEGASLSDSVSIKYADGIFTAARKKNG